MQHFMSNSVSPRNCGIIYFSETKIENREYRRKKNYSEGWKDMKWQGMG